MYHVIYYIPSIYFITLTTFTQFPLSLPPACDNHEFDLLFYDLVYLCLKYNWPAGFYYTAQWFDISVCFKMITKVSLITICHQHKGVK